MWRELQPQWSSNGDVFSSLSVTAALRSYSAKYADAVLRRTMFKEWFLFQNKLESSLLFFLSAIRLLWMSAVSQPKSDYFCQALQTSDKQPHWNSRSTSSHFYQVFRSFTTLTLQLSINRKSLLTIERFWERNWDKQVDCDSSKESVAMFVDVKRL